MPFSKWQSKASSQTQAFRSFRSESQMKHTSDASNPMFSATSFSLQQATVTLSAQLETRSLALSNLQNSDLDAFKSGFSDSSGATLHPSLRFPLCHCQVQAQRFSWENSTSERYLIEPSGPKNLRVFKSLLSPLSSHIEKGMEVSGVRKMQKNSHTGSENVSGLAGLKTSLHVMTVTRSSVSLRLIILCVHPGIM